MKPLKNKWMVACLMLSIVMVTAIFGSYFTEDNHKAYQDLHTISIVFGILASIAALLSARKPKL